MADGFIWYELVTNDMDKAVNFYKKVVGWDIKDSGMPGMKYMLFGKDGKDVGGMMTWAGAGAPELPAQWMGHIHTAKLDEELKAVTADGGDYCETRSGHPRRRSFRGRAAIRKR